MRWVESGSVEVKIRNLRGGNITITSAEIYDLQPGHLTPVILCLNRDGPAQNEDTYSFGLCSHLFITSKIY